MMTILLVVIFISFIAVGLPDAMLGTAWPAIYTEFDLPISLAGYISMIISGCTVVSSLFSTRLINRFGTGVITAVSTILTAIALFGFALTNNSAFFFLLAIPLGLGAGSVDSSLNSFVALHYSAAQMNFLQCFYGLGVIVSPYLMSLALGDGSNWRQGYFTVASIQTGLAIFSLLTIPLWKSVEKHWEGQEESQPKVLTLKQMLKMPAIRMTCLVFFICCAVELTAGSWSSTYFVNTKGVPPEQAAQITMLFYIGFSLSRFLSGIFAKKLSCWQMVWMSSGILLAAILLLLLPLSVPLSAATLFFAGFGIGPLFANLTHLTPQNFGRDIAQSVIGLQMAATYLGIMLMPPLFGTLAQTFSTSLFPYFLLVMHLLFLLALIRLVKLLKKHPLGNTP